MKNPSSYVKLGTKQIFILSYSVISPFFLQIRKFLLSYADVFSDCINALAYGGKQYLNPQNTQPAPTESCYKCKKPHIQFCDASRYLMDEDTICLKYIIENETELEERQILRKIS